MALHAFRDSLANAAVSWRTRRPATARYQEQAAHALRDFCEASRLSLPELAELLAGSTGRDVSVRQLEIWLDGEEEFPAWLVPATVQAARAREIARRPARHPIRIAMGVLVAVACLSGVGAIAYYWSPPPSSQHQGTVRGGGWTFMTPFQTPSQAAVSANPTASSAPGVIPARGPVGHVTPTPTSTSMQAPQVTKHPAPPSQPPTRSATPTPAPATPGPSSAPAPTPTNPPPASSASTAPPSSGGGLLGGLLGLLGL
jgi:hypothetical protein